MTLAKLAMLCAEGMTMPEGNPYWQFIAPLAESIFRQGGASYNACEAAAWDEWARLKRVVTIKRENMRRAKLASKPARAVGTFRNSIRGL